MSTVVVDARYNYWNSVYGPNDVVRITSGVDASQWLGSEMKYEFHRGEDIINPATGNFSRKYTDMTLKSPGIDLFLGRTYNSTEDRNDSLLGKGWTFSFDSSIKEYSSKITLQDGTVKSYTLPFIKVVRLSDGSIQMFDVNEDGTFSCKDTRNKLIKQVERCLRMRLARATRRAAASPSLKCCTELKFVELMDACLFQCAKRKKNTRGVHLNGQ